MAKQKVYYAGTEAHEFETDLEEWEMWEWLEEKFYEQLPSSLKNDINKDLRYGFYENPRIWIDRRGLTNGEFHSLDGYLQKELRRFNEMFQEDRKRDARLEAQRKLIEERNARRGL
jgi:hypothetical protein